MNTGLKERLRVIAETADVALLEQPLRSLEDLEAIERVPLEERLKITDFCRRMDIALAAHDPAEPVGVWLELIEDFHGLPIQQRSDRRIAWNPDAAIQL